MAQVINTNIPSMNAQRNLNLSQMMLSTSLQRLSSGLRVNSAKDDAAGLAIAERMNAQIRGMNVAQRNANDAISLSQTAEGALGRVGDNLQRMRELAVQSANASNSLSDRTNLDAEYKQLSAEVTRVLTGTKFNGVDLLNTAATLTFQVGANDIITDKVDVLTTDLAAGAGVTAALAGDVLSSGAALTAMTNLDTAIGEITTGRATFGAAQNRFDAIVSNLQVAVENQTASRSRIMDADFAVETANMTRASILQQAGTAMLAQANALPNTVLTLLRG
jgi:flagellin